MSISERIAAIKERVRNQSGSPRGARPTVKAVRDRSLPCIFQGEPTGEMRDCPSCAGTVSLKVLSCSVHGKCTVKKAADGITCCAQCPDYVAKPTPDVISLPKLVARFDHTNLYSGLSGKRFNPALIEWGDGYVFCWRDGWQGSNLWVCRLDRSFIPAGYALRLDLTTAESNYGREDPTFFIHNGKLHVSFVGVVGVGNRVTRTAMLYARLSDRFKVEAIYAPKAPGIPLARWQKNWQWLSHGGELYAIYSIDPHRVLRVMGGDAEWAHKTPAVFPWAGGERRGGAAPVMVDGEWWSFFHDSIDLDRKTYRIGLYTFSARPPFRQTGYIAGPVMTAVRSTLNDNYAHVVFPRGAVVVGEDVVLSCGVNDRHTELLSFPLAELRGALKRV